MSKDDLVTLIADDFLGSRVFDGDEPDEDTSKDENSAEEPDKDKDKDSAEEPDKTRPRNRPASRSGATPGRPPGAGGA